MSKENYKILGVSQNASDEEIEAQYQALKSKYAEEQWQDGEAGTEAARMLNKLDRAYSEIKEERAEKQYSSKGGAAALKEVSALIKKGDIAGAQAKLDNFNERGAEWHYLQSVVFYKKNWMNESKKQLEIAMQIDSSNPKYREAYTKMNARTDYQSQTGGAPNTNPNMNTDDRQMGGNWCANCFQCCYTYLCVNCLFNLCCGCN